MIDYIKSPVRNPNAIRLLEIDQYTFDVDTKVTKTQVKSWIEGFFGVKVIGINSHCPPPQKKRMGPTPGYAVRYKRMIVRIKSSQSIPVF